MIQEFHKGVEIELEIHQMQHGLWKCDYTLITHPERTQSITEIGISSRWT
jgi:hypothetical protein